MFSPSTYFDVKTIILFTLLSVISLHFISLIPSLYRSFNDYKQAERAHYLNNIGDNLYAAVENYGFERGRVNVILNDSGPVEKMEENRKFIIAKRKDGDKSLMDAIEKLQILKIKDLNITIDKINSLTNEIAENRKKTARDIVIPKAKREDGLADIWFSSMTQYIENIENLLVIISADISDADGIISRYSSLKHEALALRNTAGPEMSILSGTILSGKPINPELAKKIGDLQISTKHHFQSLAFLSKSLSNSQIPDALNKLEKIYYEEYFPYREIVFPLALKGGPYPYSQSEFLGQGVKALQQISAFMASVVEVTEKHAESQLNENKQRIIVQLASGLGTLGIIILILFFVHFRVIKPITLVTSTVRRLAQKDLTVEVPLTDVQDEIGEMARAVAVFKGMALQLEEDVISLKLAEEKIRISEERFRTVADFSYDWEYWIDPNGQLKYISPSCERITGYKPEEFMDNINLLSAICLNGDDDTIGTHFKSDYSENEPSASINFKILKKDGGISWLNHICQPITGNGGLFLGRRACNRDITDQKKLEEDLIKAKKLEATAILAGGIAHDFNNLLAVATGNIELFEETLNGGGAEHRFLKNAQLALARAVDLTSKFITFSSGGTPYKKPTDINSFVSEIAASILTGTNINLAVILPLESWQVDIDKRQISQVVQALVVNAKEAMLGGGRLELTIQNLESIASEKAVVAILPENKYVKVTFKDEGVGFSESNLEKAFDPYFSTKEMGAEKGMGLGLTIAHAIINKHNGYITIVPPRGDGSAVVFYLPLTDQHSSQRR
jgi:PAS domain S-box-containing protein